MIFPLMAGRAGIRRETGALSVRKSLFLPKIMIRIGWTEVPWEYCFTWSVLVHHQEGGAEDGEPLQFHQGTAGRFEGVGLGGAHHQQDGDTRHWSSLAPTQVPWRHETAEIAAFHNISDTPFAFP